MKKTRCGICKGRGWTMAKTVRHINKRTKRGSRPASAVKESFRQVCACSAGGSWYLTRRKGGDLPCDAAAPFGGRKL